MLDSNRIHCGTLLVYCIARFVVIQGKLSKYYINYFASGIRFRVICALITIPTFASGISLLFLFKDRGNRKEELACNLVDKEIFLSFVPMVKFLVLREKQI